MGSSLDGKLADIERVSILIEEPNDLERRVAREVLTDIRDNIQSKGQCVAGFATGNTYYGIYQEMVHLLQNDDEFGDIDLSNLTTFNLDEYVGIPTDSEQSYHTFMWKNLFDEFKKHGFKRENAHIPDGELNFEGKKIRTTDNYRALVEKNRRKLEERAEEYNRLIKERGGIDIQVCGIGTYDAHLGFNPQGSSFRSRTRLVELSDDVRKQNASDFSGFQYMPSHCITMGLGNIADARKVIVVATGERKAAIMKKVIEEPRKSKYPATVLQNHDNCNFYLDPSAAANLTRYAKPWLVQEMDWYDGRSFKGKLVDKAVITTALELGREITDLRREDYVNAELSSLLNAYDGKGGIDALNESVLERLVKKVKKGMNLPNGKKVVAAEPHGDDIIISEGGTASKLAKDNEEIILSMTNGNVSVPDDYVYFFLGSKDYRRKHMDQIGYTREDQDHIKRTLTAVKSVIELLAEQQNTTYVSKVKDIVRSLREKPTLAEDPEEVRIVKTFIRRHESVRVADDMGAVSDSLDLPFYRRSWIHKESPTDVDRKGVEEYFDEQDPDIVMYAADLTDPHGTHKVCANLLMETLKGKGVEIWGYRGAWAEFDLWDADVFVPLTTQEVETKRRRINYNHTQHHKAMFPGGDDSEFYERVARRNAGTFDKLRSLGVFNRVDMNPKDYRGAEAFTVTRS